MSYLTQKTIKNNVSFSGVALHSGLNVNICIKPAEPNFGIVFKRVDCKINNLVYPNFLNVSNTSLNTTIQNEFGVKVSTIEHLMGALFGLGIDNALVEINCEEMPIMDGSSKNFLDVFKEIKIISLLSKRKYLKVNKKVQLNNKKDLLIYSYRVAGTVGLMMAKILNVKDNNSMKAAIDLGIAMQLTNISRDVVEDSKINRFYIKNDFKTISDTLTLADLFYKSSFIAIKEIPFKFRFAILVARRVYKKIGDKILRTKNIENYNKAGKIYVNNIAKIYQTILSVFDLVTLFLTKQKSSYMNNEHFLISEEIDLNERI